MKWLVSVIFLISEGNAVRRWAWPGKCVLLISWREIPSAVGENLQIATHFIDRTAEGFRFTWNSSRRPVNGCMSSDRHPDISWDNLESTHHLVPLRTSGRWEETKQNDCEPYLGSSAVATKIHRKVTCTRIRLPANKDNKEHVDVERNGPVFSDGIGTISQEALEDIWDKHSAGRMKPIFPQIRYQGMFLEFRARLVLCVFNTSAADAMPIFRWYLYAGAKGVISLNSRLKDKSVFIRP